MSAIFLSEDLRLKLNVLLNSTKSKFRFRSLLGLISVLDFLDINGYILFDDAYEIYYSSFFENSPNKALFRDTILGYDIGLLIWYFTHPTNYKKYICIRSSNVRIENTIKGFAKLHAGLVVLVKRIFQSLLIFYCKIPNLCQSLAKSAQNFWSCLTGLTHFANSAIKMLLWDFKLAQEEKSALNIQCPKWNN